MLALFARIRDNSGQKHRFHPHCTASAITDCSKHVLHEKAGHFLTKARHRVAAHPLQTSNSAADSSWQGSYGIPLMESRGVMVPPGSETHRRRPSWPSAGHQSIRLPMAVPMAGRKPGVRSGAHALPFSARSADCAPRARAAPPAPAAPRAAGPAARQAPPPDSESP